ncbi:MAG: hypothetical protein IKK43_04375 [Clostridia bacterium]|nr:hypothetical protein [Clostridia bacterium]
MEDSLAIVFAILVSIILMFLFPLLDTWELQDNLSYATTYAAVVDFVDTVRNVGYISPEAYYNFESKLMMTGNTFSVRLEHRKFIEDGGVNDYLNTYTNEIMAKLDAGEIYPLNQWDYFYVTIKNTNKTQASVIQNFLFAGADETFKIGTAYGGIVWARSE